MEQLHKLVGFQSNAMLILSKSKMPIDDIENFTNTYRDLLLLGLNITSTGFELSEDEQLALLSIIVVKSLEMVENA